MRGAMTLELGRPSAAAAVLAVAPADAGKTNQLRFIPPALADSRARFELGGKNGSS